MIDDTSPPGSWRDALDPEGACCAACGQNVCGHSDLEYQGVFPVAPANDRGNRLSGDNGSSSLGFQHFHSSGVASVRQ